MALIRHLYTFHPRDIIPSLCHISWVLIHECVDVLFQSLLDFSKVSIYTLTMPHCLGLFCFTCPVQS